MMQVEIKSVKRSLESFRRDLDKRDYKGWDSSWLVRVKRGEWKLVYDFKGFEGENKSYWLTGSNYGYLLCQVIHTQPISTR